VSGLISRAADASCILVSFGEAQQIYTKSSRLKIVGRFLRAVASILLMAGCQQKVESISAVSNDSNQTLRRGLGGEPSSLDPSSAPDTYSSEVLADVYEGLTMESADGTVVPGVAMSWTVDSGGTKYVFHLRPDARWSNGTSVRAQDFVNAWRRVVDPKTASPVADNLLIIRGAEEIIAGKAGLDSLSVFAPKDDLLEVTLTRPAPYFPQLLTHYSTFPVFSESAAKTHDPKTWISNGPYVLSSWIPGGTIQLSKNPSYWDRSRVGIQNVIYLPLSNENAEWLRYRAGELDVTESVPVSALPIIQKERASELHVTPFLGTLYYAFNLHSGPFKNNLALRKALTMAIDRRAILKALQPFGQEPAFGFVPKGTANYQPQPWDWAEEADSVRLAEARALFAKAGYSRPVPLHLKILFNSSPGIKQMAVAVAGMWRDTLGVETDIEDEEYRVFLESRKDFSRWNVVRLAWLADYNDAASFLETFHTGSANDDSGYSNPRFDELTDEASRTADEQRRREILESAERTMLEDYPIVPIYFFSSKRLFQPYVHGATPNSLNRLYSKYLTIEPH
jgi:oligopeptide transport system substrate-binding protein